MNITRLRCWVTVSVLWLAGSLCVTAVAGAAVGAGAFWTGFPDTVTVGEVIPGSLSVQNLNDGADYSTFNSVCNAGDASPPCESPEPGIVSVPSCGKPLPGPQCAAAGADPGVFELSTTGIGSPGSYCHGTAFSIAVVDPAFGTVRFTPLPPGVHLSMPGFNTCDIRFAMRVMRLPTIDADPATAGLQTARLTTHTQWAGPFGPSAPTARGTATGVATVLPGSPPPPPPPPPPPLPDIASFAGSATTLRVSQSGRFAISFVATPGRKGKAKLTSTQKVKIGSAKRKMKIPSKSFAAPSDGKTKMKFKLSAKNLKALKRAKTLKFKLSVTVGTTSFSAKLKLKAPKPS